MKKIVNKILFPLGTVCATTTAIVPTLVSCNESKQVFDLMQYEPTIEQLAEGTVATEDDAASKLFGQSNSIDIVKQDILVHLKSNIVNWTTMKDILIILGYDVGYLGNEIKSAEADFSNLKIEYKDGNKALLSGDLHLKMTVDMFRDSNANEDPVGTFTLETKHKISKIQYVVKKSQAGKWNTNFDVQNFLLKDKNWSVKRTYTAYGVYNNPENPSDFVESTYVYNLYTTRTTVDQDLLKIICWDSYYLANNN